MNVAASLELVLSPLQAPVPPALAAMTFPAYRHFLSLAPAPRHPELGERDAVQPFGVVACRGGEAVGLALAEEPLRVRSNAVAADGKAGSAAELLSVFVAPAARGAGVATALVEGIERAARDRGHRRLVATYTTARPAIARMERIFASRGWDAPQPGSLVVRFDPRAGLGNSRFRPAVLRGYARELEIFPWSELAAGEMDEIRRSDAERCWIEPSLAPWQYAPGELDPSSVGARCRGRVVGWVLNHRVSRDTVRWSISYMHPALARRGKIFALYHASIARLVEEGSCRVCTFTTPYSYPPMVAAAKRWVGEITREIWESRRIKVDLARATRTADAAAGGGEATVLGAP